MKNSSTLIDAIIKDEANGIPRHEVVVKLGPTPEILQYHAGFPNLELVVTGSVISKACFDHGISTSVLKRLEDLVNSPKAIYKSANLHNADSVVVMTFELQRGAPIIVPVRQSVRIGRSENFNQISSVYGKEGPNPDIKWTRDGLKLWSGN